MNKLSETVEISISAEKLPEENTKLAEFLKQNEEHRAEIAHRLTAAHEILDGLCIPYNDGEAMLTVAQRIQILADQNIKLRAACEAALDFVRIHSLLSQDKYYSELREQLSAALEGEK